MDKLKTGIVGVVAVAILVLIGGYFQPKMRKKDEALAQQTDRIAQLEGENERLSNLVISAKSGAPQPSDPPRELLRLRGEVGVLRQQTSELGRLRKENTRLSQAVAEAETNQLPAEDQVTVRQTHAVDAMTTLLQAIKNYAVAHNGQSPASLDQLIASGGLATTNLAGNLRPDDFEFGQGVGMDPGDPPAILRLRVPIAKPGGGALMIVGGIDDTGVPHTSVWNVAP